MVASNHSLAGTVEALQYTGSNTAEVVLTLGSSWHVYTCTSSNIIVIYRAGNETLPFATVVNPTDWLVTQPAYGSDVPTLTNGFQVIQNSNFTQQYN